MTTDNSSSSQRLKNVKWKKVDLKNFGFNWPNLTTEITLFDENGEATKEAVPKKYWSNKRKAQQYLEQRLQGIIKQGEDINLEKVKFTRLEHLEYDDEGLNQAVKLFVKVRDSKEKLEVIEGFFLQAKEHILKIDPPTKESLDCLIVYARGVGYFYEREFKKYEKAAREFFDCGVLIAPTYPESGFWFITESPKILLDNGLHEKSHEYFTNCIIYTLKCKNYGKSLELLEEEIKQYYKEKKLHTRGRRMNTAEQCDLQLWGRICGVCVIKIGLQGIDKAHCYYKEQLKLDDIQYDASKIAKNTCDEIITAFRNNDSERLEKLKSSRTQNRRRDLPSYVNDLITKLDLKGSETSKDLNKKHSQKQL